MNYRGIARRELDVMGAFRSPWLRSAFDAVDREVFVPDAFWGYGTDDRGRHEVIDRRVDEDAWRRAVWSTHRSLITQMNDGDTAELGPTAGDFSSSVSALDIAFEKLNQLAVEPGHRVLHVGNGLRRRPGRVGGDRALRPGHLDGGRTKHPSSVARAVQRGGDHPDAFQYPLRPRWPPEAADAVTVYGDRDLWSELVDAYSAWRLAGQPHYTRSG